MTIKRNQNHKILISVILFLLLAIIGNTVNAAADVYYSVRWNPIGDYLGRITVGGNTSWFCGERHGQLRNRTYKFIENDDFEINKNNHMDFQYMAYIFSFFEEDADAYASYYDEISNLFGERQRAMNSIRDDEYKALQQILWESKTYTGKNLFNNGESYTNLTQKAQEWKAEGKIYQEYIKALGEEYKVIPNEEEAEVAVNRDKGTVTFGKYSIDYLYQGVESSKIDQSGRSVMFSGIEDIIVYNEATGEEIDNIKLIREDGTIIGNKGGYQYPINNEKFYIEIPYSEEISNIKIKVKFKYIDGMQSNFRRFTLDNTIIEHHSEAYCDRYNKGEGCCWDWASSISQDLLKYNYTHITWKRHEIDLGIPDSESEWTFEIDKIDLETKNILSDAYFTVKIEQSENNKSWILWQGKAEYKARGGKITISDLTCYGYVKFIIEETKAPNGYEKLDKPIEVIVYKKQGINGNITWYEVNGEERKLYDDNGNLIGDNELTKSENKNLKTTVNNSSGAQKFTITIPNRPLDPASFVIKLNKVNSYSKPLSKAQFSFTLYKIENGNRVKVFAINYKDDEYEKILTTNSDGIIFLDKDIIEQLGDLSSNGDYELIVKEDTAPLGYKVTYYQARIPFTMKNGKIDEIHTEDIMVKTSKQSTKEKTYRYTDSGQIIAEKYKDDIGIELWIENYRRSSSGGTYRREGFDIVLNKILLDNADNETNALEGIKFDIVLKKGNTVLQTWKNKQTSSNGKITLSNIQYDGELTLEITEKLTDNQQNLYGIIGEATKTVTFTAKSETISRVTRYYIAKDSWSIKGNSSGIQIESPVVSESTTNIDEITITIKNKGEGIPIGINVAGTVFIDSITSKAGKADGLFNVGDDVLENVEVTLLYYENGKTVEKDRLGDDLLNPIRSDENGKYEFINLNPMKQYKVKFTYNGQDYEDAEYFAPENSTVPSYDYCTDEQNILKEEAWAYNTEDWAKLSKALENNNERAIVNARFADIGDYPESYVRTDTEGNQIKNSQGNLEFNAAYSKDEIAEMYDLIAENDTYQATNTEEQMMLNYIEDCKVSAYTDAYPAFNIFRISDKNGKVWAINQSTGVYSEEDAIALYDGQNQINFGLRLRPDVDLRISDTVAKIDVHVNNKQEAYTYTELENVIAYLRTFDIQRNTQANEEGTAWYGENADDLDIYVTHKIEITNESATVVEVKDFIDYYNKLYYTIHSIDGVFNSNGERIGEVSNVYYNYNDDTYSAEKISISGKRLEEGESEFVYVTLKLNGNGKANASEVLSEDANLLENNKVTAGRTTSNMNYVEISGYSTGAEVGLVDKDSVAGNFSPNAYEAEPLAYYVEDDTSGVVTTFKTLEENYNTRTLSGNVFEDKRVNLSEENKTIDTNPIYEDSEISKIKGMTVELVEIIGNVYVTRAKTETDVDGNYTFKNYIPGNYVVRFTYGDKTYEVDGSETIYNGQHYQSTYSNPNTNEIKYWYTDSAKYSDAYDKVQDRENVIWYANESLVSSNVGSGLSMNYYKTKLLKNEYDYEGMTDSEKQKMIDANTIEAYTSKLELEVESMITNESTVTKAIAASEYNISDVDFGLVKRAESKMTLEQHLSHLTITQSDGSILVDTPVKIETNWLGQSEIVLESGSDKVHFQNVGTKNSYGVGTAKLEIDDEILIGNIDLEYTITVRNDTPNATTLTYYKDGNNETVAIGYYEEQKEQLIYWEDNGIIYYNEFDAEIKTNIVRNEPEVVTTKAENIINYVSTNLNYDSFKNGEENAVWELITAPDATLVGGVDNRKAVNNSGYKDYNQVLLAKDGNSLIGISLTPGNEVKETLVLSATNVQDVDLNYYNVMEILELENSAGRVDAYSTPGNLEPGEEKDYLSGDVYSFGVITADRQANYKAYEPDSTQAEHVLITDTTGDAHYYYVLIGAVLVIFTTGIILIKKFVVDKKA